MYTSGDINARNIIKIRSLLKNCITLLETKDRPDISLLANCLLIELYADVDRENEKEDESDSEVKKSRENSIESCLKSFNATLSEKSELVVIVWK